MPDLRPLGLEVTTNGRHGRRWVGAVLLVALGLTGSLTPVPAQSTAPDAPSVLRPGDGVRVTVWRKPEYSGDFLITADSTIAHPLYRNIRVVGVPLPMVRTRLEQYLGRLEQNPELIVEPLFRVAVGGQVREPDLLSLPAGTSISQAIALAGGPTEQGRLNKVRLVRDTERIALDLTDPKAPAAAMTVRSGDQIFVERGRNFFREIMLPLLTVAGSVASLVLVFDNTR